MNLVEWNPFRDMDLMGMGNFLERSPFRFFNAGTPRVDLYQTDNEVVMKAELPGVSKDDVNVYVDDNSIRISGQAKRNDEFKDENIYRSERYFGSFSRTIPLPTEIKPEQATAEYRDGILSIRAPKASPSQGKGKRLDIQ